MKILGLVHDTLISVPFYCHLDLALSKKRHKHGMCLASGAARQ